MPFKQQFKPVNVVIIKVRNHYHVEFSIVQPGLAICQRFDGFFYPAGPF